MLLAGGTVIGQGMGILAAPLLTRLYSPTDFGVLVIYSSFLGILGAVTSLRYEWAIPLPKHDADAATLVALSGFALIISTALIAVGVVFFGETLFSRLNEVHAIAYRWLIPIGAFAVGMYQILNYWAIRYRHFKSVAKTKISQGVSMSITQLTLGYFSLGPLGLLLGDIVGRAMGVVGLSTMMLRKERIHFNEIGRASCRERV